MTDRQNGPAVHSRPGGPARKAGPAAAGSSLTRGSRPIRLRLIHDGGTLICEVSDSSHTAPHLRRARIFDEGGRGLLLVAQLTRCWGSRHTADGKTIWAELSSAQEEPATRDQPAAGGRATDQRATDGRATGRPEDGPSSTGWPAAGQ